jgi:RHS repeat-associated protein
MRRATPSLRLNRGSRAIRVTARAVVISQVLSAVPTYGAPIADAVANASTAASVLGRTRAASALKRTISDVIEAVRPAQSPSTTLRRIRPNRTVPAVTPPVLDVHFDEWPTTEEISRARMLPHPLLPSGAVPSQEENRALAGALKAFSSQRDAAVLESYIERNPGSPWLAAVYLNVGSLRRNDGYFSRAAVYWLQAWDLAKYGDDQASRTVADVAIGEWLTQQTMFGRVQEVEARLSELEGRTVRGTAGNKVESARESLWLLKNRHEDAIFSGPEALKALLGVLPSRNPDAAGTIAQFHPSPQGTSLTELQHLAARVGVPLQMRFIHGDEPFPIPSIVHLKSEHFSTIVGEKNGGFVLRDVSLGGELVLGTAALRDELSGYVLAPVSGARPGRSVPSGEASTVMGHCTPGKSFDDEPCGCGGGGAGMPSYTLHPLTAAVILNDVPLTYSPPRGPAINVHLRYNQRTQRLSQTQDHWNIGPQWSLDWHSYVTDNNTSVLAPYEWTHVLLRGEGSESYNSYSGYTHWKSRAELSKVAHDPPRYERGLPDGTVEVYAFPDRAASLPNRKVFLTEVVDPQGQTLTFTYDSNVRLVSVTDAIGQVTTLDYDDPADSMRVTTITDPFSRTTMFTYDSAGRLASITDAIGMTSRFGYADDDFLLTMTTPYGTTTFVKGDAPGGLGYRRIDAIDPEGGTERVEFHISDTTGLSATAPSGEVPSGYSTYNQELDKRNSLYWSKLAMAQSPGQLSSAVITHWLMGTEMAYAPHPLSRRIPHSVKNPLEHRIWYKYPDQGSAYSTAGVGDQPSEIARVLEGGATQVWQATYNAQGQVTSRTDPLGRQTTYSYATNGIDLLEVRQTRPGGSDLLASYEDYVDHRAQAIIDAAGETISVTYNAAGQVLTVTNPLDETTTYGYNTAGFLTSVTGPVSGATTTYTYDAYGRVATVTDADDYTVTTASDALNRVISRGYPDNTSETFAYERLDLVAQTDRNGRTTRHYYDRVGRRTGTRDPLGRVIRQEWCGCGALNALIDGNGNRTAWARDVQGRVITETRADGTTDTTYTYDATGRLETVTDPLEQVTTHAYFADDALDETTYTDAVVATPSVGYTYDSVYPRIATTVDGMGTTSYTYRAPGALGAGHVATVDGPLANDTITYTYDELGRVVERDINATDVTWAFDALGRVTSEVNVLGTFTYTYEGVTARLATVTYPNSQTSTYSYFGNSGDHRLQTIHHKYPNASTLSKYDYTYDAVGNILTWQLQADSASPTIWLYGYDAANQLMRAVHQTTGGSPTTLKRYGYGYDPAGNRTHEQIDDAITAASYDSSNRLLSHNAGGRLTFAGSLNEPGTVTVQGVPATVAATNAFGGVVPLSAGINEVTVVARDATGNQTTQGYEVEVAGQAKTFTYDANGNLTSDGSREFSWDGRNQLVSVAVDDHRTEFSYDGRRRRVRVIEKESGTTQSDSRLVWCENVICEERVDGNVSKRILELGVSSSVARFYSRDHLGSVRDVTTNGATRVALYTYDPYGRQTASQGSEKAVEGFAAYSSSSVDLVMAYYRQYDANLGRWLNQDPGGLSQGPNLHLYVGNKPTRGIDPFGDAECKECAISVKCRSVNHWVKWLGAKHCAAELNLEDGTTWHREAGPGGEDDRLLVGGAWPGPADGRTFWREKPSSCKKVKCVKDTGDGYVGEYDWYSNNSNQYLERILNTCGYNVNIPMYAII